MPHGDEVVLLPPLGTADFVPSVCAGVGQLCASLYQVGTMQQQQKK
jgi:hypothetical protein